MHYKSGNAGNGAVKGAQIAGQRKEKKKLYI